jgi:hypothetical protein
VFEASGISTVVIIALLHVLVGLLLLPLLLLPIGLPVLPRAAYPSHSAAGKAADGRSFARAFTASSNTTDNCSPGATGYATFERAAAHTFPFLGWRRGSCCGHFHGIKACLSLGPLDLAWQLV